MSLLIPLRIIHVACGVYWAGTLFFFVTYLEPGVRAAGPEGGKVMAQLFARRFLNVLPAVALLTILSGLWLLWIVSDGFRGQWMGSAMGVTLSLGGAVALGAFLLGVLVMRPAAQHVWRIGRELPQVADEARRDALAAELQAHRRRSATTARVVAALLAIAVVCMSVARYV
jgi:hypothetical protein